MKRDAVSTSDTRQRRPTRCRNSEEASNSWVVLCTGEVYGRKVEGSQGLKVAGSKGRRVRRKTMKLPQTIALCAVLLTTTLTAHHGWSDYDQTKTLTLKGVIREMSYSNPHGMIRL